MSEYVFWLPEMTYLWMCNECGVSVVCQAAISSFSPTAARTYVRAGILVHIFSGSVCLNILQLSHGGQLYEVLIHFMQFSFLSPFYYCLVFFAVTGDGWLFGSRRQLRSRWWWVIRALFPFDHSNC